MVTIAPCVVVAVAVVVVDTVLPGCTRAPTNTLMMPARPVMGERMVS